MSLRFQRLILILITLIMLATALLLILFNTKQNISLEKAMIIYEHIKTIICLNNLRIIS